MNRNSAAESLAAMTQKGSAHRSTFLAVRKLHGDAGLTALLAALPQPIRAQLEPDVMPMHWYPIEVSAGLHLGIRDTFGKGDWAHSHTVGVEAANIDFTGIYKVLIRTVSVERIWGKIEQVWGNYNSKGLCERLEVKPGYARIRISGVTGFNLGMWNAVAGRAQALLQMTGLRGPNVSVTQSNTTQVTIESLWLE
jgi:hypothetical protein